MPHVDKGSPLHTIGPFEWDEAKRRQNLAKHGVDFRRAVQIFDGDVLEMAEVRRDYGEERIRCLGQIEGRVYRIVYTPRRRSSDYQCLESQCQRPKNILRA